MRIGYLGPAGTFTHQAAISAFSSDENNEYVPLHDLSAILQAVELDSIDYGTLPFENSTNGHVVPALDALREIKDIVVVREVYLDVHQCLLSTTALHKVRRIYSHAQAFGQCEFFLSKIPEVERINVSSTGHAAQLAVQDSESAAIASATSALLHKNLRIMHRDIEDNKDNTTRFFILGKRQLAQEPCGPQKTLLRFKTGTKPGSLAMILQMFGQSGINLTSICSRPESARPREKWLYVFFLEFEGHSLDPHIQDTLSRIEEGGASFQMRCLGSFADLRRSPCLGPQTLGLSDM